MDIKITLPIGVTPEWIERTINGKLWQIQNSRCRSMALNNLKFAHREEFNQIYQQARDTIQVEPISVKVIDQTKKY